MISEKNYFTISNKTNESGFFFFDYIDALRKFITFGAKATIDHKVIHFIDTGSQQQCFILFNILPIEIQYETTRLEWHNFLFSLSQCLEKIQETFGGWLNFTRNNPEVCNLYFYSNHGMQHDKFLAIAQALEQFHRCTTTGTNSWGYKSRIKKLFERFDYVMRFTGDSDEFSTLVLDHRDYYAHWFDKKKDKVFKGVKFDYLRRDVNLLLEMCFLEICGFAPAEIEWTIRNNHRYAAYLEIDPQTGNQRANLKRPLWR